MKRHVKLIPVQPEQAEAFVRMAQRYFCELNPQFRPTSAWREAFSGRLLLGNNPVVRWIGDDTTVMGFVIFGHQPHPYLPKRVGVVYELYVVPEHRHSGVASLAAAEVIEALRNCSVDRVQLEVMEGNQGAAIFWRKIGFAKVAERYVLPLRGRG